MPQGFLEPQAAQEARRARAAAASHASAHASAPSGPRGLAKRVIACLDVRSNDAGDLVVTKVRVYSRVGASVCVSVSHGCDAVAVGGPGRTQLRCKTGGYQGCVCVRVVGAQWRWFICARAAGAHPWPRGLQQRMCFGCVCGDPSQFSHGMRMTLHSVAPWPCTTAPRPPPRILPPPVQPRFSPSRCTQYPQTPPPSLPAVPHAVQGDQYDVREKAGEREVRNLGKPVDLAARYFEEGADEVAFLNITGFR